MGMYTAAIEFGTSKIICTAAKCDSPGAIQIVGSSSIEYQGLNRGRWVAPKSVQDSVLKAIDQCERAAGRRLKSINVGVPGCFTDVTVRSAKLPLRSRDGRIFPEHIDAFVDEAGRFDIPESMSVIWAKPVYFMLDDGSYYLNPVGKRSANLSGKASFACVETDFIEDMEYIFDNLKIDIDSFIPESFAQAMFIPAVERDMVAVHVDVGYSDTNISIVHGDAVVYLATIYMGGADITADLAECLEIPAVDAEVLKRRYSFGLFSDEFELKDYVKTTRGLKSFDHQYVQKIIDARVEYLATIIYNKIAESGIDFSNRSCVFLSGGGICAMQGSRDFVQKFLDMPVRILKYTQAGGSSPYYMTSQALINMACSQEDEGAAMQVENKKPSLFERIMAFLGGSK